MGSPVSRSHPLRQLFGALTEKSFTEHLGWPDLNVTEYVSNLLVEFAHTDQLYKIQNTQGRAVDSVVEMLFESEVLLEAHDNLNIDNMEGIAAHRSASGETILTLISDDNFSALQRTLLMQFALTDGKPVLAEPGAR